MDCLSSLRVSGFGGGGGGCPFGVRVGDGTRRVSLDEHGCSIRLSGSNFSRFPVSDFSSSCSSSVKDVLRGLFLLARGFPANTASPSPSVAEKSSWGGDDGGVRGSPKDSSSIPFFGLWFKNSSGIKESARLSL